MFRRLALFSLVATVCEIALLIWVKSLTSWTTVGIACAVSAVVGVVILQTWGFGARSRRRAERPEQATPELWDGLMISIAARLFIAPGFISDFLGLLLLIPQVRRYARKRFVEYLQRQLGRTMPGAPRPTDNDADVIDVPSRSVDLDRLDRQNFRRE